MNTNLDKIALDLYGKIQTRFSDIKMGDENAGVLSKKSDIPHARFFEFEYKENGVSLGTIAITLDEDDGIILQISGDIANNKHEGAFKFIRSFRQFAKDRLINFDVQNIGKDNLDKRDYEFQSKPKEEPMEPMMESKLYGTARMSYQDLGEAKLIVKHSQMINPDLPAGRTMHIESIYVENADGERFKYPYKHLNGARALAEHLKHGGNPYDPIGQHISSLSEELAQLRKFKGYVSRNANLSEAMGDITTKVMERIDAVKKEVAGLQRPAYYTQFAESFEAREDQMIPEDVMSDWIDRLTIRSFNEDLRTAFPYIFRLVDESSIPVKELSPTDMLGEDEDDKEDTPHSHQAKTTLKHLKKASYSDRADAAKIKSGVAGYRDRVAMLKRDEDKDNLNELRSEEKDEHGNVVRWKEEGEWTKKSGKEGRGKVTNLSDKARRETEKMKKKDEVEAFESFLDGIVNEDEAVSQDGENTLFSPNKATQQAAIDKFNEIMKTELKGGPEGINVIDSLKGLIDDPEFLQKMQDIDPDLDARGVIQTELNTMAKEDPEVARLIPQLDFKGNGEIGGQELPPEAPPAPEAGAMPPAAPAPAPAPDAAAGTVPPAPAPEAPPAPVAESVDRKREGMLKVINKAKKAGAKLDTKLDLGHREMTLHDCIRESGLTAQECGFDDGDEMGSGDPVKDMLKSISGFWNAEERNFTIGGTRCKTKIIKDFKDGMFKGATPEDVHKCVALIDKMDPSSKHNQDLGDIKRLAGVKQMSVVHHHSPEVEVDEASEQDDFAKMMSQFKQMHPQADIGKMMQQVQSDPNAKITHSNTSSGTVNGKPSNYDDAMKQMPKISFGGQDFDMNQPDQMHDKIKGMMGGMMGKMQSQAPNQDIEFPGGKMNPQGMMKGMMDKFNMQESDELSNILKIAGVKK